jgi:hypothetical protein
VVKLEIDAVISNRLYGYLIDIVNESKKTENRVLYEFIIDYVNQSLAHFNNIIANKKIMVQDKVLDVSSSILNGIKLDLKSKEELVVSEDEIIIEVQLGDKLYSKYVDLIKLTYYLNSNSNIKFDWSNINEFTSILIQNAILNKFNEIEKKELEDEMKQELKINDGGKDE